MRGTVAAIDCPGGSVPLIGREAELAEVAWLLSGAADGCVALSLVAAAGAGKTALLDEAGQRARAAGYRTLRCTGVEAESDLAYSALSDLLTPVTSDVRDWLPTPLQRALDVVALRVDPSDNVVEPQAVARAALSALLHAAERAPMLVIVDDAHWLDAESRRALAFAIRRADGRIAVLAARRPQPELRRDELTDALRSLDDRHHETRLAVLSAEEIERLLSDRGFSLPRAALRRIQRLASGNPLYALELARAAVHGSEDSGAVPASLDTLLRARIAALSAEPLTVVGAAAQMSAPSRALIRRAVAGEASFHPDDADAGVDAAVDAGILTEHDAGLRFSHPLLAEAATLTTTAAFRRRVHQRLADEVTDVTARAVHLSMAHHEPDEDVAHAIEAGGTQARARAAPEVAGELLMASLRLTPERDTGSRRRRRLACAYHWVAAGNVNKGIELLTEALAEEPLGDDRADLEWRTAMLHFLAGDLNNCITLLESARRNCTDAQLRRDLDVRLASMRCWTGRFRDAAALCDRLDIEHLTGVPRINALGNLAVAHFATGEPSPVDAHGLISEFQALRPEPAPHEHPASRLVHILVATEPADQVATVLQPAVDAALAAEDDIGIAWNTSALARALQHAGRWSDAHAAAHESLRAARRADSSPALALALTAASVSAAYRGDSAAASKLADELIQVGTPQPYMMCVEQGHLVRGFLALSFGDADTAATEMSSATASLAEAGVVEPTMPPLRWFLLAALIDAGLTTEAEAELAALSRITDRRDHALAAAVAWTARGRLAALRGDRAACDEAFALALQAHTRLGWPFERAATIFEQGRVFRHQQRRGLARGALTDAANRFAQLGASQWEARAHQELAAVSGRAPAAPTSLTETEQRVARLAATGLKNHEIAEQLFVSTKTVATHLSHVYAKLHLRSRTELARHFASATTAP